MKDVYPLVSFLVLGLFLGFLRLASSRLDGHSATPTSQPATTHLDGAQNAKLFLGRILEVDGKFVLRDSVSNDTYLLDNQEKAKPFEGRQVKVTGVLDAASRTIHVL
jgi:hypothetical protein